MNLSQLFKSRFFSSIGKKLKKIKQKGLRAFTLIELLIVIAIVAILAAVIIVGTSSAQASARDAGRLSDLSQTKKSLQAYYLAYNSYPTTSEDGISLEENATFTQTMKNSGYMSTVPRDPKYTASAGEYTYKYISTASDAFTLCAKSEAKSGNYFCATQDSGEVSQTSSAPVFGVWGGGGTITVFKSPTATGDDYNDWLFPTNAYFSDDLYAEMTSALPEDQPEYQDYYNFSFNIPSGASINGVEISIEARKYFIPETDSFIYIELSYDGGINYTSTGKWKRFGESEEIKIYGSPTDIWGRTWSDSEFSNSNFRVRISHDRTLDASSPALDHVQAKVYYTSP